MKLYSDFPARRIRQITADLVALALIAASICLGVFVHSLVSDLAAFSIQVEAAGEGFEETMNDVGGRFAGVPLLGGGVENLFDDASSAGGGLADAGRSGQTAINNLALGLGWAIAVLPVIAILALWLFPRIRFVRRAAAAQRMMSHGGSLDLLALRALATQDLASLNRVSTDAAAAWRRGDTETVRALASLELRSSGVRVPRLPTGTGGQSLPRR
jgi:hypothetical protein